MVGDGLIHINTTLFQLLIERSILPGYIEALQHYPPNPFDLHLNTILAYLSAPALASAFGSTLRGA